jgi:transcriptional regulator with XRE-family HTH domain
MKNFSDILSKLPPERRARIEAATRGKLAAIRLQRAREQVGVTQMELAVRLHMTQPALSRFERRPNITINVLQKYVEALGWKLEVTMVKPGPGRGLKRKTTKANIDLPDRIDLFTV